MTHQQQITPPREAADLAGDLAAKNDPQDWELIASEGHTIGHRMNKAGKWAWGGGIAALAAAYFLSGLAITPTFATLPDFAASPLQEAMNPNTFTKIPGKGDLRTTYRLAWVEDITAHDGITEEQWRALTAAAVRDVRSHGDDAGSFEYLPEVATAAPTITRPEKVGGYIDSFANGIIAIPEDMSEPAQVVGFADGELSWVIFNGRDCITVLGPTIEGCRNGDPQNYVDAMSELRPRVEQMQKGE